MLALVTELYLEGQRVDITVVASRLGLGRATIYRWFGSREALLGEVVARQLELLVARKRAEVRPARRRGLLEVLDRVNQHAHPLAGGPPAARAGAPTARCGCSPRAPGWSNRGRWRASRP